MDGWIPALLMGLEIMTSWGNIFNGLRVWFFAKSNVNSPDLEWGGVLQDATPSNIVEGSKLYIFIESVLMTLKLHQTPWSRDTPETFPTIFPALRRGTRSDQSVNQYSPLPHLLPAHLATCILNKYIVSDTNSILATILNRSRNTCKTTIIDVYSDFCVINDRAHNPNCFTDEEYLKCFNCHRNCISSPYTKAGNSVRVPLSACLLLRLIFLAFWFGRYFANWKPLNEEQTELERRQAAKLEGNIPVEPAKIKARERAEL